MLENPPVLFEEMKGKGGDLGIIILNRPTVLNSLNYEMILLMAAQLKEWAAAAHIKAVVIKAVEGRAFCAGGDLRLLYERRALNDPAATRFFEEEYQLNRLIYHYPKPYIAFLDGITMGGGVGISLHGSHRIATERLLFAMPETGIGFFPDVGGTHFLPRLPGKVGYYLGLTGARIKTDDSVAIGLATHKVPSSALPTLLNQLANNHLTNHAAVSAIIDSFTVTAVESSLLQHQVMIDHCFDAIHMEDIIENLNATHSAISVEILKMLQSKSPTSLKVTLSALIRGHQLDFDAAMEQELNLTKHFCAQHDFMEGIRALIIDKDQLPVWQPAKLEGVTARLVENYFKPVTS